MARAWKLWEQAEVNQIRQSIVSHLHPGRAGCARNLRTRDCRLDVLASFAADWQEVTYGSSYEYGIRTTKRLVLIAGYIPNEAKLMLSFCCRHQLRCHVDCEGHGDIVLNLLQRLRFLYERAELLHSRVVELVPLKHKALDWQLSTETVWQSEKERSVSLGAEAELLVASFSQLFCEGSAHGATTDPEDVLKERLLQICHRVPFSVGYMPLCDRHCEQCLLEGNMLELEQGIHF
mmetsp:Transcript_19184/g.47932  ORF Transcript_19184/g.47932 Transcript_19184/m.47932 type:complete len:234 (+) Transcript_19184:268-969(+)